DAGLSKGERVDSGGVAAWEGRELSGAVLRERRLLGRAGALHVSVVVDGKGRPVAKPAVWARGVLDDERDGSALRFVELEVVKALEDRSVRGQSDDAIGEVARIAARRG